MFQGVANLHTCLKPIISNALDLPFLTAVPVATKPENMSIVISCSLYSKAGRRISFVDKCVVVWVPGVAFIPLTGHSLLPNKKAKPFVLSNL